MGRNAVSEINSYFVLCWFVRFYVLFNYLKAMLGLPNIQVTCSSCSQYPVSTISPLPFWCMSAWFPIASTSIYLLLWLPRPALTTCMAGLKCWEINTPLEYLSSNNLLDFENKYSNFFLSGNNSEVYFYIGSTGLKLRLPTVVINLMANPS